MVTGQIDPLVLGHRVRHFRRAAGLTLDDLGELVGKPGSYLSLLENGKREPRLGLINRLAAALDVPATDLLSIEPPSRRAGLEMGLVRVQDDQLYRDLGLPRLKASSGLPDLAIEHILTLYSALQGRDELVPTTREEARIANAQLRAEMRTHGNHYADIEKIARETLAAVGHDGPVAVTEGDIQALATHFGFTIVRSQQVPFGVQSLTDLRNRVIYIPQRDALSTRRARSVVVRTLGHFALGHEPVDTFADFLRQRIESNYFAGAVLVPEAVAVAALREAKKERDLAIEDLRDTFYVSYEMAAHRFTNLATRHLDLPVHFSRVDETGIIWKAYENDGVPFPRNSIGAIEGLRACRHWGARRAFSSRDKFAIHYQYTDTPAGTFWCRTHVDENQMVAVTVGTRFEDAQYFRGRDTTRHDVSTCPDPGCCRRASRPLADRWEGWAWPSIRPDSHVLAAMPVDTMPGVDEQDLYEFLDKPTG